MTSKQAITHTGNTGRGDEARFGNMYQPSPRMMTGASGMTIHPWQRAYPLVNELDRPLPGCAFIYHRQLNPTSVLLSCLPLRPCLTRHSPLIDTRFRHRYKRYRLGNEKGFDTLFFPEKELLLKILDNFQHKTGQRPPPSPSLLQKIVILVEKNTSQPFVLALYVP